MTPICVSELSSHWPREGLTYRLFGAEFNRRMQTQRQLDQYDRISLNLKENIVILSLDNVFENGVYKMSAYVRASM